MRRFFVRIVGNGYDRNGNWTNRVFAYEPQEGMERMWRRVPKDTVKILVHGRYNSKDGSVTTQDTKEQVMMSFAMAAEDLHEKCESHFVIE